MLVSYLVLLSAQFVKPKCNFSSEILLCVLHITSVTTELSFRQARKGNRHTHTHTAEERPQVKVFMSEMATRLSDVCMC